MFLRNGMKFDFITRKYVYHLQDTYWKEMFVIEIQFIYQLHILILRLVIYLWNGLGKWICFNITKDFDINWAFNNQLKFQFPIFVRHKFSCPHLPILQNQQLKVKLFMKKDVGVIDTQSHIKWHGRSGSGG